MLVLKCYPKYWTELKDFFTANLRGIPAQKGPWISFIGLKNQLLSDHISVNRRARIEKLVAMCDPKVSSKSKTFYPLPLNVMQPPSSLVSLPEHALTSGRCQIQ